MTVPLARVRWMATPESWQDILALYAGLETVAFWQPDDTLDVETRRGRERAPAGSWICRQADGSIVVAAADAF